MMSHWIWTVLSSIILIGMVGFIVLLWVSMWLYYKRLFAVTPPVLLMESESSGERGT